MEKKIYQEGMEVGMEISTDQQSSIKISQNAKGEKSFEVKVYCDDAETLRDKLDCYLAIARRIITEG